MALFPYALQYYTMDFCLVLEGVLHTTNYYVEFPS